MTFRRTNARRGTRGWIGGTARVLAAAVALSLLLLAILQLFPAGRVFTVRSIVRLERLWSRDFPVAGVRGAIRGLEPALTRAGLLRPVRVTVEPGVSLLLDPSDDVARTILVSRTGRWEPEVWGAIAGGLSRDAVFLDVGAHIGYDTLKASLVVGDGGRVVAFEPNPRTLAQLEANIAASGRPNIIVQPVACTDVETTLTLFDSTATGNSGSSSLSAENAGSANQPYSVRGRPIDAVVEELRLARVDLLKADVEGAELLVLRGARATLARFHPKLVLEVVPEQLQHMGTSVEELEAFIRSLGYTSSRQVDYKNREYWVNRQ